MVRAGAVRGVLVGFAVFRAAFLEVLLRGALVSLIQRLRGADLAAARFAAFRRRGLAALRVLLRAGDAFLLTVFLRAVALR